MPGDAEDLVHSLSIFTANYWTMDQRGAEASERTNQFSPSEQVDFVMAAAAMLARGQGGDTLHEPLTAVLRRKLDFTPAQILELAQLGANPSYYFPFAQVLRLAASSRMTPSCGPRSKPCEARACSNPARDFPTSSAGSMTYSPPRNHTAVARDPRIRRRDLRQ